MNRREFLSQFLGIAAILPAAVAVLGGCDGGSDSDSGGSFEDETDEDCSTGAGVDYTNPGHDHTTIALSPEEITNAIPGTYLLLGGGHSHTFELTAGDFADLQAGLPLTLSNDIPNHGHIIEIRC